MSVFICRLFFVEFFITGLISLFKLVIFVITVMGVILTLQSIEADRQANMADFMQKVKAQIQAVNAK